MSIKRHKHFVSADCLALVHKELMSSPGWTFKGNYWRYYIIRDLAPYVEQDCATWYCNQSRAMNGISQPWRQLFDSVFELAGPKFQFMRYALNGQTQNQFAQLHKDVEILENSEQWRTYLIYLNLDYSRSWGGQTEILMPTGLRHQEWPESGKMIEYNSQLWHIGQPPEVPNVLRLTLALQGKITL
jgi:hypothetical protein